MTQGDIQQLLIDDDPRAAETYCQDYIPDCDAPLPYNSILTEAEEVSPPLNSQSQKAEGKIRTSLSTLRATGPIPHVALCEASQVLNDLALKVAYK